jgi:tyrosine-protein kinase Etk/Wzc
LMAEFSIEEAKSRREYYLEQTAELKTKIQMMESELKSTGMNVDVLKLDMGSLVAEVANLKASISSAEIRLRSMQSYLATTAPEYKLALSERDSLQLQLDKLQQAKPVQAQDDKYQEKFRDYVYNLELVGLLSKQAELAQFDANKNEVHLQVLDVAEPAERKSGPSYRNTLLLTTVISGFLLLIFVFIRHAFRSAAQDQQMAAKFKRLRSSLRRVFFGQRKETP